MKVMRSYERNLERGFDEDPGRPTRTHKDTRKWCRGKVGRSHVPEKVVRRKHLPPCHETVSGMWQCFHEEVCANCGKVLRTYHETTCPLIPEGIEYCYPKTRMNDDSLRTQP